MSPHALRLVNINFSQILLGHGPVAFTLTVLGKYFLPYRLRQPCSFLALVRL